MPTLSRVDGLRIVIYPNDHRPAHVHVIGSRGEAAFFLNCPDGPPELRERFGFRLAEVNRIQRYLISELATLCNEWSRIHGNY